MWLALGFTPSFYYPLISHTPQITDNIHKTIYTPRISGRFGIFRRSRDQFKMATSMREQQTNMMIYEENELVTITPEDEQEAVNSLDNLVLSSDDEYFVDLDSSFNERETT